jgi:hypothetical protein
MAIQEPKGLTRKRQRHVRYCLPIFCELVKERRCPRKSQRTLSTHRKRLGRDKFLQLDSVDALARIEASSHNYTGCGGSAVSLTKTLACLVSRRGEPRVVFDHLCEAGWPHSIVEVAREGFDPGVVAKLKALRGPGASVSV